MFLSWPQTTDWKIRSYRFHKHWCYMIWDDTMPMTKVDESSILPFFFYTLRTFDSIFRIHFQIWSELFNFPALWFNYTLVNVYLCVYTEPKSLSLKLQEIKVTKFLFISLGNNGNIPRVLFINMPHAFEYFHLN